MQFPTKICFVNTIFLSLRIYGLNNQIKYVEQN